MKNKERSSAHVLSAPAKYRGMHVAYEDFNGKRIVAAGDNPATVINEARRLGFENAVLSYIPEDNVTFAY